MRFFLFYIPRRQFFNVLPQTSNINITGEVLVVGRTRGGKIMQQINVNTMYVFTVVGHLRARDIHVILTSLILFLCV